MKPQNQTRVLSPHHRVWVNRTNRQQRIYLLFSYPTEVSGSPSARSHTLSQDFFSYCCWKHTMNTLPLNLWSTKEAIRPVCHVLQRQPCLSQGQCLDEQCVHSEIYTLSKMKQKVIISLLSCHKKTIIRTANSLFLSNQQLCSEIQFMQYYRVKIEWGYLRII